MPMTKAKDKEKTKQKILDAIHTILVEEGFNAIGVNRIAKDAGIDKVLIYRYFGGLEGALKAYTATDRCWPPIEDLLGMSVPQFAELSYTEQRKSISKSSLRALASRPSTLNLLVWELVEDNPLVGLLNESRMGQASQILELMMGNKASGDEFDAVDLVLASAVHHLALQSKASHPILDDTPKEDQHWSPIFNALDRICDALALLEETERKSKGGSKQASTKVARMSA